MCRSAEDCGLVLHEIAGADGQDPASAGKSFYYAPQFSRDLKDVRVGFAPVDFDEWADPAARADTAVMVGMRCAGHANTNAARRQFVAREAASAL
jgi:Asp-tRNA(Asn)/Glu-tRNA(Gln) amidotransferase A subunit family amidase